MGRGIALLLALMLLMGIPALGMGEGKQADIAYMKDWPTLPSPMRTRDWAETAREVTLLMLSGNAGLPYFPATRYFTQETPLTGGFTGENFLTLSYLNPRAGEGEAVTQLAAVLTASLAEGIDPRSLNGRDYAAMAQAFFSKTPDGRGFISNNLSVDDCADSYWYTLYPTILYFDLAAQYPEDAVFQSHMRAVADTWLDALGYIDTWDAQGVSLRNRMTVQGGHTEPEGIFGAAYVMLTAYERFGDQAYLKAAVRLMREAADRIDNPYYEILGSYAPYIAARLNAEQNAGLPLGRMLDWVFTDGRTSARMDWGLMDGKWGDYDAYGLSGSLSDLSHGYAFAMNTFVTAGAIAPVARYAPQYSRAIGQYLLAAAANSQMFLTDGLPTALQDDGDYVDRTGVSCLVYEGVRNRSVTTPFATGDIKAYSHTGTNFSFYSSGPIGLLYGMLKNTDVPEILCVDLLKTDFWHGAAYPTYLLYNPLKESRTVTLDVGEQPADVYDAASGQYLAKNVAGKYPLAIPGDAAVQAVLIPAGLPLVRRGNRIMAGDVTVTYSGSFADMPDLAEGALLKGDTRISLRTCLPDGEEIADVRLTCGGVTLYEGTEMPPSFILSPAALGTGLHVLKLSVRTGLGEELSCNKGIAALAEKPGNALLNMSGADLSALSKSSDNCKCALTEEGLKLDLIWGGIFIDCPAVAVSPDDQPVILVSVPSCTGRWGLQGVVRGTEHYIRTDSCAAGEFLCDLGALLKDWGVSEGETSLTLHIFASGTRDEVVLGGVRLLKGGK